MEQQTSPLKPAVFLDRDGTLNVEVDYLHRVEDVSLVPGGGEAVADLNRRGIPVVVVTNQSGIGQGRFGWEEFRAVSARLDELLAAHGAHLDATYVAPHSPRGRDEYHHPDHPDRKPNPGMLQRAAEDHGLDLQHSWMVGDKDIDLEAGRAAGCKVALVLTGYGRRMDPDQADLVAADVGTAIARILEQWPKT